MRQNGHFCGKLDSNLCVKMNHLCKGNEEETIDIFFAPRISVLIINIHNMNNLEIQERQLSRVDSLMWKVTKLLTKKKKMILDEFELTCSQFDILAAIHYFSKNNNEVIQINLSERTQIDPMTTSTILRNLEKRSLIKRERGLINTRTVEVKLTQTGKDLYTMARQKIETMRIDLYKNLDQKQFASQLSILSDTLNK